MLVIVRSVLGVPVAVVDVVDVVAVAYGAVAAVRPVLVLVLGRLVVGRRHGRERLPAAAARRRTQTPTGHVIANPTSDSSTIVGPGATVAWNERYADSTSPPREAAAPSTMAASSVVRNERVSCCDVATGTTISAETSSSPTVRIATETLTAASTATSTL